MTRVALALLAAAPACVTPPVVIPASNAEWSLEASSYPADAEVVELVREGAPTLRGLFVPSDAGAPLVVHFAESGGSVTSSFHARDQYADLAALGFASLALDYRGVGLSDGEPAPRALAEDAAAMYAHGLDLVGGDERRLVVRGTSLGSLAIAALLERDAAPGAVVLFAPVFADTVAVRFGYATRWDPFVWLVRPFLRSFLDADLAQELADVRAPLLVVAAEEDELTSTDEHRRLAAAVEAAGGRLQRPSPLIRVTLDDVPLTKQLEWHIAVSLHSYKASSAERELLAAAFPGTPDRAARVAAAYEEGDPDLVRRVRADAAATRRLEDVVARIRGRAANEVLGAALHLKDADEALELFDTLPSRGWATKDPFLGRSAAELDRIFDHADPAGPIPTAMTVGARRALGGIWLDREAPLADDWTPELVVALARAVRGRPDGRLVHAADGVLEGEDAPPIQFRAHGEDLEVHVRRPDGSRWSRSLYDTELRKALETEAHLPPADQDRRLVRAILKAVGLPDRVRADDGHVEVVSADRVLAVPLLTGE